MFIYIYVYIYIYTHICIYIHRTRAPSRAVVQSGARATSQWRRKADGSMGSRGKPSGMNCPSICQVRSCPSTAAKFPVRPPHPKLHPNCDRVQASCGSPTMVGKRTICNGPPKNFKWSCRRPTPRRQCGDSELEEATRYAAQDRVLPPRRGSDDQRAVAPSVPTKKVRGERFVGKGFNPLSTSSSKPRRPDPLLFAV